MNTGYHINKIISRPSWELIQKFAEVPIPNIGDSMNRTAAISSEIQAVNGARLMGTAYTVRVPAGDNLLFYYAIDQAQPGDVIVVDGGGFTQRALCGEIMATYAQKWGLAGFVINGVIRDKVEISQMDFPVFAIASCPNGPYKNGPGEINVPVNMGGRIICPGDILIGDGNGLVSFRPEEAEDILSKVHIVMEKERHMMDDIEQNGHHICGEAFTVHYVPCGPVKGTVGDFIDDVEPGQVVVIDNAGRDYCTVWGDIMPFIQKENTWLPVRSVYR